MIRTSAHAVDAAVRWLAGSGVQQPGGGFAAWYDAGTHDHPYVYAEITGYLITLMCQRYAGTKEPHLLASAIAAGDWLVRTADPGTGAFRCLVPLRPSRFDDKRDLVFAFDTGVIVNGLANLHRATADDRYLAAAVRAADWLVDAAQRPDGAFRPVWDAGAGAFAGEADDWSWRSGGYHAKVASGLANLAELAGGKYRAAATRAADHVLAVVDTGGRLSGHAHPHAYAAEGLWVTGHLLERPGHLAASRRAAGALLAMQRADGLVPRFVRDGTAHYAERIDVQAQALRLACLHDLPGRRGELAGVLRAHQAGGDDPRARGGIWFGRLSDGSPVPHVNVWTTAFTVQALALHDGGTLDPRLLV